MLTMQPWTLQRMRDWLQKVPPEVKYTLLLFLATRAALTIIGLFSRALLPKPFVFPEYVTFTGHPVLDIWGVWDAWWYSGIADYGYLPVFPPRTYGNYAFFPLYPLLMRGLGILFGNTYVAGLLISNVSLILAGIYLYRLARKDEDHQTSLNTITALFIFPTAFIFSGALTEGLFLLLAVLAFFHAREGHWTLAGIFGMLVALTKQLGFLILIPLAIEYCLAHGRSFRRAWPLLLIPAGLGLVMLADYAVVGDPLGFLHIQSDFGRSMSPVQLFAAFYSSPANLLSAACAAAGLALLFLNYRRLRTSYFVFGAYSILVPLATGTVLSIPRFLLQAFPLFIIIGRGLKGRAAMAIAVSLALLQGFLMVFWTTQSLLVI